MSEGTEDKTAATPPAALQSNALNLFSVFQFLKDNFVVVSSLAAFGGVAFATIFFSAYLTEFDWHLIWFVQSTDVITFGLIAAGLIGSSLLMLFAVANSVLSAKMPNGKLNWQFIVIGAVVATLALAFQIYGEHAGPDPHYSHIVTGWVTVFAVMSVIIVIASHAHSGSWPTISQSIAIMVGAIAGTISFGRWVALAVIASPEIAQDVVTKDQTFASVKVVIVMSRHTILLNDENLFVIPTAEITEFRGKGSLLATHPPVSRMK